MFIGFEIVELLWREKLKVPVSEVHLEVVGVPVDEDSLIGELNDALRGDEDLGRVEVLIGQ